MLITFETIIKSYCKNMNAILTIFNHEIDSLRLSISMIKKTLQLPHLNLTVPYVDTVNFLFIFFKKKSKIYSVVLSRSPHARYPRIQSATPYI